MAIPTGSKYRYRKSSAILEKLISREFTDFIKSSKKYLKFRQEKENKKRSGCFKKDTIYVK